MRVPIKLAAIGAIVLGVSSLAQPALADGGVETGTGDADTEGPPTMTPGAILAHYCGDADMRCMMAPLDFDYTHTLVKWLPNWDTGWVPASFKELQVRFVLQMPTDTQVAMSGQLRTTWPTALTMAVPGDRFSGFLRIDYGLIVSARAKIDIKIAGIPAIDWEGPIPYIPQVDFHLLGLKEFDAWVYPPESVSVSAFAPQFKLFEFNILDLVGVPSTIAKGGVALDIRAELKATYRTEKMVIVPSQAPISTDEGETGLEFKGGSYVEVDVYPDGKMTYDGIVHLIPTIFVDIAGGLGHFEIPIYDFPINITSLLNLNLAGQIPFDKIRVHVPLPDILPFQENAVVDFGTVLVGSGDKTSIELTNVGEAKARAVGEVEPSMAKVFKMLSPATIIDPGESGEMAVRFTPTKPGKYETKLTVRSNDPDLPEQTITLKGRAVYEDDPDYEPPDGEEKPNPGIEADSPAQDGCSCRTIGGTGSAQSAQAEYSGYWAHWIGLFGVVGLGLGMRGRGFGRRYWRLSSKF
ncbi:MAG: DUF1573 domain-containing protein [Polyangiaceae bacterium]|nr:DUF1573 domain-containing protein [Polyangiaceae bacterium]